MSTYILSGPRTLSGQRDELGHRTYKIKTRVGCTRFANSPHFRDGPANVMQTPGLPVPGAFWLINNDVDVWAWVRWDAVVTPEAPEGEPCQYYDVEQTASTKPVELCDESQVQDPLLIPMKVSGSFAKFHEEATEALDCRVGAGASLRVTTKVVSSAWEQLRGPAVEFDANREIIKIEQNVASLGRNVYGPMVNTVNNAPLWGAITRAVKLNCVSFERKFTGFCQVYYTRILEFDIYEKKDPETGLTVSGHDRKVLDEGTKCLRGDWLQFGDDLIWNVDDDLVAGLSHISPDQSKYQRFVDPRGNICRCLLNGNAIPVAADEDPGKVSIKKYTESNFLALGLPTTL